MKQNRRGFLKSSALLAGAALIGKNEVKGFTKNFNAGNKNMKLTFEPYTLELKHVFTIATSSRTTTPVMLTKIEYDGFVGYGEASMPPYLGESQDTAAKFLSKVDLSQFKNPFELETILDYVDSIEEKNTAAKASVDGYSITTQSYSLSSLSAIGISIVLVSPEIVE